MLAQARVRSSSRARLAALEELELELAWQRRAPDMRCSLDKPGHTAGTSATSLANLNAISTVLLSGQSIPPTYIYPDTEAGNAGLCRLVASQMVMPNDPLTPAQVGLQTPAIEAYLEGQRILVYTTSQTHCWSLLAPRIRFCRCRMI
jgi:hypothetical protein